MGGGSSKNATVICCGLDDSGKTTIINRMKPSKERQTDIGPTVGYSTEKFNFKKVNFTVFDLSGDTRFRSIWESYYSDIEAIIFVIDASDGLRMAVVKHELDELLKHPDVHALPILFFANKQDKPGAISDAEIVRMLDLDSIEDRKWAIFPSIAIDGDGIEDGMKWIAEEVKSKKK